MEDDGCCDDSPWSLAWTPPDSALADVTNSVTSLDVDDVMTPTDVRALDLSPQRHHSLLNTGTDATASSNSSWCDVTDDSHLAMTSSPPPKHSFTGQ